MYPTPDQQVVDTIRAMGLCPRCHSPVNVYGSTSLTSSYEKMEDDNAEFVLYRNCRACGILLEECREPLTVNLLHIEKQKLWKTIPYPRKSL